MISEDSTIQADQTSLSKTIFSPINDQSTIVNEDVLMTVNSSMPNEYDQSMFCICNYEIQT